MANLSITAANSYHNDGTISTNFVIREFNTGKEIVNISLSELRNLSALISNALADTATTHNTATVRAYNARKTSNRLPLG